MRIFLADDEKYALKYLFDCLTELRPEAELVSFDRSDEALEYIRKDAAFDVAFLDISMPVINGVELAKELKKLNPTINIVFCTAHEQYAMDAVKLHVSGYSIKFCITRTKVSAIIATYILFLFLLVYESRMTITKKPTISPMSVANIIVPYVISFVIFYFLRFPPLTEKFAFYCRVVVMNGLNK